MLAEALTSVILIPGYTWNIVREKRRKYKIAYQILNMCVNIPFTPILLTEVSHNI